MTNMKPIILAILLSGSAGNALAVPANDNFADATPITEFPACIFQKETLGATIEVDEPTLPLLDRPRPSVWFSWTAADEGLVEFSLVGSSGEIASSSGTGDGGGSSSSSSSSSGGGTGTARVGFALGVFVGDSLMTIAPAPGEEIISIDTIRVLRSAVPVVAGTTYRIAVFVPDTEIDSPLALTLKPVSRPANDDFADAQPIPADPISSRAAFDTAWGTEEPGPVDNPGDSFGPSIWYSWEPPSSGNYRVSIETTDPSNVAIFTGDRLTGLERVISRGSDSIGSFFQIPTTIFSAEAGTTYRIAINAFDSVNTPSAGHASGDLVLTRIPRVEENDAFADRIDLGSTVPRTFISGNGMRAPAEPGEPDPAPFRGGSVWYSFTPDASGVYEFASSEGQLQIYTGDSLAGLTRLERVTASHFQLEAGTTYQLSDIDVIGQTWTITGPALLPNDGAVSRIDLGATNSASSRILNIAGIGSATPHVWTLKPLSTGVATLDGRVVFGAVSLRVFADDGTLPIAAVGSREALLKFPVVAGQALTIEALPLSLSTLAYDINFQGFLGFDLNVVPEGGNLLPALVPTDIQVTLVGEMATLTWTPDPGTAPGTLYQVLQSSTLEVFSPVGMPATGNSTSVDASAPLSFFRIEASLP